MNYVIDTESNIPAYFQIYEMIRKDIVDGVYETGSKLPSKRTLMNKTGVSIITVEHALMLLDEEGYIESKERRGYFVIYRKIDFAYREPEGGNANIKTYMSAVDLSLSKSNEKSDDSESFSMDVMAKTMRKVILEHADEILQKCPNSGLEKLRDEIKSYLARSRGIIVDTEQIIIGSGAEYLYGLIALLFSEEKLFAIEKPSYEKIKMVYDNYGKNIIELPLDSKGIRSEKLQKLYADILHITPFHSYPSGATADVSKRNEYIEWANFNNAFIVEDNYDSELTVSVKAEESLFAMDNERVIYINTFSKTISASVRMGYMILPKHLLEKYDAKLGKYSCTVPVFEQLVMAELMESGHFERHINRVRRNRRRR